MLNKHPLKTFTLMRNWNKSTICSQNEVLLNFIFLIVPKILRMSRDSYFAFFFLNKKFLFSFSFDFGLSEKCQNVCVCYEREREREREREQYAPCPPLAISISATTPPICPTMLLDAQWAGRHLDFAEASATPRSEFCYFR